MSEHISTAEAARLLGVTPQTIIRFYHAGILSGFMLATNAGKRTHVYKISVESIRQLQEEGKRTRS